MSALDSNLLVERYLQCIRTQDLEGIVALFAEEASCVMPNGQRFAGHAAVRQWFTHVFAAQALDPKVLGVVLARARSQWRSRTCCRMAACETRRTSTF